MSKALACAVAIGAVLATTSASARLIELKLGAPEPFVEGRSFGETGPYVRLKGTARGELDPKAPEHADIVGLDRAPRNARGMVEYATDFLILKPVDMHKGNGKIFYTINNRGNTGVRSLTDSTTGGNNPSAAADAGNGFTMRQGYAIVDAGWEGDVLPLNFRLTADYPVATNAGATITAPILVEFHDRYTNDPRIAANGRVSLPLSGSLDFAAYESVSTDPAVAHAELRVRSEHVLPPGRPARLRLDELRATDPRRHDRPDLGHP